MKVTCQKVNNQSEEMYQTPTFMDKHMQHWQVGHKKI